MQNDSLLNRREFTLQSALAILSGVTITITGCGDDSPTAPSGSVSGTIAANHGHTANITQAQLTARNSVMLDIRGSSDHPHTVEVSASNIASIATGQRVTVTSTTDQLHSHTVTFN